MKLALFLLLPALSFASALPPTPFPVFLKEGFSSVLDFEEAPSRVVLGDSQSFQIERLGNSIVLKPLVPYAVTNMFVYFVKDEARLFVLTASEEAEPTYYRKFETPKLEPPKDTSQPTARASLVRGIRVSKINRDAKNDYLTADFIVTADTTAPIKPLWDKAGLRYKNKVIAPLNLWAERKEILRDSAVKSRFIFAKPNVPKNLKGVSLVLPIAGSMTPLVVQLERYGR